MNHLSIRLKEKRHLSCLLITEIIFRIAARMESKLKLGYASDRSGHLMRAKARSVGSYLNAQQDKALNSVHTYSAFWVIKTFPDF